MLKKLAVPFLTLSLVAFGCSSSTSTPKDGGTGGAAGSGAGGKGGSAGGAGGAAGSGAGGAAGSGAGGAAGSGAGGVADAGPQDRPGTGGTTDAGGVDAPLSTAAMAVAAMCGVDGGTGSNMDVAMFTPEQFCTLFTELCGSLATNAALKVMGTCVTTYMGWTSTTSNEGMHGQQGCRSYHLCNAFNTKNLTLHCPHAEGLASMGADAVTGPCP